MKNEEKSLVGKVVSKVQLSTDKLAMLFTTVDGEQLVAMVDADCCSYTWIESVEMPALGCPFKVISVENLDMGKPDVSDENWECLQFYGAKITTDKGVMIIDYRNESNGYYGGSMCWPEETHHYGGVYGQSVYTQEWGTEL